jgi:hypothetical protein
VLWKKQRIFTEGDRGGIESSAPKGAVHAKTKTFDFTIFISLVWQHNQLR